MDKTDKRAIRARRELLGIYAFLSASFKVILFILLVAMAVLLMINGGGH